MNLPAKTAAVCLRTVENKKLTRYTTIKEINQEHGSIQAFCDKICEQHRVDELNVVYAFYKNPIHNSYNKVGETKYTKGGDKQTPETTETKNQPNTTTMQGNQNSFQLGNLGHAELEVAHKYMNYPSLEKENEALKAKIEALQRDYDTIKEEKLELKQELRDKERDLKDASEKKSNFKMEDVTSFLGSIGADKIVEGLSSKITGGGQASNLAGQGEAFIESLPQTAREVVLGAKENPQYAQFCYAIGVKLKELETPEAQEAFMQEVGELIEKQYTIN